MLVCVPMAWSGVSSLFDFVVVVIAVILILF